MIRLCHGIDDSKVASSGEFKSISDEDSFKDCSTVDDARKRLKGLVEGLLPRVSWDIGIPQTVRVTVRRPEEKSYKRESRQCALPRTISFTDKEKAGDMLLDVCFSLFKKVVDVKKPFHLNLLGVSLTNFRKPCLAQSKDISNFFQKSHPKHADLTSFALCSSPASKGEYPGEKDYLSALLKSDEVELSHQNGNEGGTTNIKDQEPQGSSELTSQHTQQNGTITAGVSMDVNEPAIICPSGIDPAVFAELPSELQRELEAHWLQQDKGTVNTNKVTAKGKKHSGIQRYFSRENVNKDSRALK